MEYLLNGFYALLAIFGIVVMSFLIVAALIVGVVAIAALISKVVSLLRNDRTSDGGGV